MFYRTLFRKRSVDDIASILGYSVSTLSSTWTCTASIHGIRKWFSSKTWVGVGVSNSGLCWV